MKRRSFLTGILTAIASTTLPIPAMAMAEASYPADIPVGFIIPDHNGALFCIYAGRGRWVPAAGELLPVAEYPELYEVLGTLFGWDGEWEAGEKIRDSVLHTTHFGLPKLVDENDIAAGVRWNNSFLPLLSKPAGVATFQPEPTEDELTAEVERAAAFAAHDDYYGPNDPRNGPHQMPDYAEIILREPEIVAG